MFRKEGFFILPINGDSLAISNIENFLSEIRDNFNINPFINSLIGILKFDEFLINKPDDINLNHLFKNNKYTIFFDLKLNPNIELFEQIIHDLVSIKNANWISISINEYTLDKLSIIKTFPHVKFIAQPPLPDNIKLTKRNINQFQKYIELAKKLNFYGIFVNPKLIEYCKKIGIEAICKTYYIDHENKFNCELTPNSIIKYNPSHIVLNQDWFEENEENFQIFKSILQEKIKLNIKEKIKNFKNNNLQKDNIQLNEFYTDELFYYFYLIYTQIGFKLPIKLTIKPILDSDIYFSSILSIFLSNVFRRKVEVKFNKPTSKNEAIIIVSKIINENNKEQIKKFIKSIQKEQSKILHICSIYSNLENIKDIDIFTLSKK